MINNLYCLENGYYHLVFETQDHASQCIHFPADSIDVAKNQRFYYRRFEPKYQLPKILYPKTIFLIVNTTYSPEPRWIYFHILYGEKIGWITTKTNNISHIKALQNI